MRTATPISTCSRITAAMRACLALAFDHGNPSFAVKDRARGANGAYLLWRYDNGAGFAFDGMSEIRLADDGRIAADLVDLPREVRRRILTRLIGETDSPVDGPTLETAMARLDAGQHASVGGLKLSPGNRILIEKAAPRR